MTPSNQSRLRGAVMILSGALLISLQDVAIKLFRADMTLWQIFALRGMLVLPLLAVFGAIRGPLREVFTGAFSVWPLLRGVFITTTFLAFYAALPFLSLSTVGAANYTAPIFITLLATFGLRHPAGPRVWMAVLIGFAGVFVLLRPGSDAFSVWALLPLMGAFFYALTHIVTATKCRDTPLLILTVSQSFVMMMAGLIVTLLLVALPPDDTLRNSIPYIFGAWGDMSASDWQVLVGLAAVSIAITALLAGAYQAAPPVMIGTLEYSYLIFVVIWDVLIFSHIPTLSGLLGMGLIVAAGLLVMRAPAPR